jgi:hypothetical protein
MKTRIVVARGHIYGSSWRQRSSVPQRSRGLSYSMRQRSRGLAYEDTHVVEV